MSDIENTPDDDLTPFAYNTDWQPYTGNCPEGIEAPKYIGMLDVQVFLWDIKQMRKLKVEAVKFADERIVLTTKGYNTWLNKGENEVSVNQ